MLLNTVFIRQHFKTIFFLFFFSFPFQTLYQDVLFHQNMVDSLASKGKNLDSPVVSEKMEQISANYTNLRSESKVSVNTFNFLINLIKCLMIWY